jgi:uncharacterized protein (DUF1800 family)
VAGIPTYSGPFGPAQAERLLFRAGFGPRPGEAAAVAAAGLDRAVAGLVRPPRLAFEGPDPIDDDGLPIAPFDAWGHDHLSWLDRMVRSNQQLVERMTLVWHDWFATGDTGPPGLGLRQNELFRKQALGSFKQLLLKVTRDPAMLIWLSGTENTKWAPNENYARELMELFTLGASAGYDERDVREQARALTGWANDWDDDTGPTNFRFEREHHDSGRKRVFGEKGRFDWRDSCTLCLEHKRHPGFLVQKLWSYFVPTPIDGATGKALRKLYVKGDYAVRPLVEAILKHPAVYEGPRMVKPPVVYIAGLLRARGRGIDTDSWTWISDLAGQRLFDPPNVAGWDETRWLDTSTLRGRWIAATRITRDDQISTDVVYDITENAAVAVDRALAYWGNPTIGGATRAELEGFAGRVEGLIDRTWKQAQFRVLRQNALRMLVATSPDLQTC